MTFLDMNISHTSDRLANINERRKDQNFAIKQCGRLGNSFVATQASLENHVEIGFPMRHVSIKVWAYIIQMNSFETALQLSVEISRLGTDSTECNFWLKSCASQKCPTLYRSFVAPYWLPNLDLHQPRKSCASQLSYFSSISRVPNESPVKVKYFRKHFSPIMSLHSLVSQSIIENFAVVSFQFSSFLVPPGLKFKIRQRVNNSALKNWTSSFVFKDWTEKFFITIESWEGEESALVNNE